MYNFVKCPFCAGHEFVSPDAADAIARMIVMGLKGSIESPLQTELFNIRNAILNMAERETIPPEEVLPLCPTPQKRKYSNFAHAAPDANKWHQHPYECKCGYWHLSKQSSDEHMAKISTHPANADEFESVVDPLLE